eukprot:TRINITY_DN15468_c0_g1_i5.p1 TRINITY_DN15468_c0_g1~~TRINITY_DN15468_c0_g1_i5.p1  ORF type:complete len:270 (+),score=87.70 TRINITY_DN15468_c0_g1_i5:216-1025(+)
MSLSTQIKELKDGGKIAVVTMEGKGELPWGTNAAEHRVNPDMVAGLNEALDAALADSEIQVVVVTGEGKFWSNGVDLKWIAANPNQADELQQSFERLLARIVTFPLPTIAAINGHFVAGGAMLGLAFDYRVAATRGLFFVPGIDIGLVYSPGMTALMVAKTPRSMHRDMIVYGKRYGFPELLENNVVDDVAPQAHLLLRNTFALAAKVAPKGSSPQYRRTMSAIKTNLYSTAVDALSVYNAETSGMGFQNVPQGQDRPTKKQSELTSKL